MESNKTGTTVAKEEIARVKGLGFLINKGTNNFNCRVVTGNGKITWEKADRVAQASKIYGSGEIALTGRLSMEIIGVPYENIEPLIKYLEEGGLETGGTGPKVRPVVSCKGTTCQYGLIDVYSLSAKVHELFYKGYHNVKLPHKFKIATGGCPNNCVKPSLNDVGIIGQRIPDFDNELCRGCKVCQIEKACPIDVPKVVDGKMLRDDSICNHCGRCIGKCPFGAVPSGKTGYKVCIGGRWGKKIAYGKPLDKIFETEEEALKTIEKCILFFKENGIAGERFSDTINRIGFENVQKELLSDEILKRKEEIITK